MGKMDGWMDGVAATTNRRETPVPKARSGGEKRWSQGKNWGFKPKLVSRRFRVSNDPENW